MMKILIVGGMGNMGSRYRAICEYLGYKYDVCDIRDSLIDKAKGCDRFLIASPTSMHETHLKALSAFNKPILCEKPIIKDSASVEHLFRKIPSLKENLTMVNQYRFFDTQDTLGETSYDYFKSGSDGLAWDCINIIGLAKMDVKIASKSPIWRCKINGQNLNLKYMDIAYVNMLRVWALDLAKDDKESYIVYAHKQVEEHVRNFLKKALLQI